MATSGCRVGRVVTSTGEHVVPVHVIAGVADVCSHNEHGMKEQDMDLIADGAGLLTSATFLLLTLNVIPHLHVPPLWQLFAVLILSAINVIAWQRTRIGAMSLREVLKSVGIGILFVGCLAVFDTIVGFGFGQRTIVDAFFHSGPFGGISDAFIFLCGLFVGIPTLVRSLCIHYCMTGP